MARNAASLSVLPIELIHAIAGSTESQSLLVLCRTSRRMHAICLEWIYRSITLDHPVEVVKCCKTIISRDEAANSVREFDISCCPRRPLKSFYGTFESAIRKLKNIQTLNVSPLPIFQVLCNMQFPRLLKCTMPASKEIIPFLKKNATIQALFIFPCFEGIDVSGVVYEGVPAFEFTTPIQPIHMSKLQRFVGPATLAYAVVPGSLTSHLTIFWENNRNMSPSDGLANLVRSNAQIVELISLVWTWDCALISAIKEHMPGIQKLQFRNVTIGEEKPEQHFFSSIENALPLLPDLMSLQVLEGFPAGPLDDEDGNDFETIRRWGELSSSLVCVSLLSNTWWGRYCEVWFPGAVDSFVKGSKITMEQRKWLRAVVTSQTLPPNYLLLAEYLAGADGIAAVRKAIESGGDIPNLVFTGGLGPGQPWSISA
ncbi:hypothetical protein C8R44DRAFT_758861 [Mycena epipterygia]|nr:hypothetical protein C8R44DRAFT_758861 [Mycena epipterygia]